jgi:hypothetical protein
VYRLAKSEFVLDRAATLAQIEKFANAYAQLAIVSKNSHEAIHRTAAEAYRAVASGMGCPQSN